MFLYLSILVFIIQSLTRCSNTLEPSDVVIVILSQNEGYHLAHADLLKKDINEQAAGLDKAAPKIILSHSTNVTGSWTIAPLLPYLSDNYSTSKWFFFCLENTVIKLEKLLNVLSKYKKDDTWLGHALYDDEPTIIHHFKDHTKRFKYPHIASGFAITSHLVKSFAEKIVEGNGMKNDFSIDPSYEFATFIYNNGEGVKLSHNPHICVVSEADCATYPRFFHPCDTSVTSENAYFAVKTCAKYHVERVTVIKKTWAKHVTHIGYYSDKADKNLPEAYIVPNTTTGHCMKTRAILEKAIEISEGTGVKWLIICDDDTMFSIARLLRLLTCYNPLNSVAIGERYGFHLWDSYNGYEYLTGGAGVVLSMPLAKKIVDSESCKCPSATTPDDMFLFGVCLARIGIKPTHSTMFHQARPLDYATALLASQDPISFHKFWMIDPVSLYKEWFAEVDSFLIQSRRHTEL